MLVKYKDSSATKSIFKAELNRFELKIFLPLDKLPRLKSWVYPTIYLHLEYTLP